MELKLIRHVVSYKMELHHIELERNSSWRYVFSSGLGAGSGSVRMIWFS